jgi:hypothetical protein
MAIPLRGAACSNAHFLFGRSRYVVCTRLCFHWSKLWRRYLILLALSKTGMVTLSVYQGTFNSDLFLGFILFLLTRMRPYPCPRSVTVLDEPLLMACLGYVWARHTKCNFIGGLATLWSCPFGMGYWQCYRCFPLCWLCVCCCVCWTICRCLPHRTLLAGRSAVWLVNGSGKVRGNDVIPGHFWESRLLLFFGGCWLSGLPNLRHGQGLAWWRGDSMNLLPAIRHCLNDISSAEADLSFQAACFCSIFFANLTWCHHKSSWAQILWRCNT